MSLQELKTIPYWNDDENDMPDNIPLINTEDAPIASRHENRLLLDEIGQYDFPCCFAERL